jgi:hypothetical protein
LVFFADFTDNFLKAYLEDEERLGMKFNTIINNKQPIQKIEVLEDKEELERVRVYINGYYDNGPLDFARQGNWELMYKVANKEYVDYDKKGKAFYDYFNSRKENPLYATHGFEKTTILKMEDSQVVANIVIELTTEKKVARRLKSA